MSRRVKVFVGSRTDVPPSYFTKRKVATHLVLIGQAEWIDDWTIKAHFPKINLRCGQEQSYETSAIEKHRVIFQGGLTRTENNPLRFQRYKGARVGHQQ